MILIITVISVKGNIPNKEYKLEIEKIQGGRGLSFSIINKGSNDITNIKIKLNTTGAGIVFPRYKQFEIPLLSPEESKQFKISLYGIGLGKIFRFSRKFEPSDFPLLNINVSSSEINSFNKKIALIVIGSLIYVGGEFFNFKGSCKGFTLFSPEFSRNTYLIDSNGDTVHFWKSRYIQGIGAYLLENGNLLRTSLGPGSVFFQAITDGVELFDWDGNRLWYFQFGDEKHHLHHDIEPLPNGNYLLTALESKTKIEAINAGKNPDIPNDYWSEFWFDYLMEVKPNGSFGADIVWEWHVWDHLIQDYDPLKDNYGNVADHPELIDINYMIDLMGKKIIDFNHINSIHYNEDLDQILLSPRHFNEIWVIDHSTTIEQSSGHTGGRYEKGGDLLYRWGNPFTYKAGDIEDQKLFCQHDARWIELGCPGEGNILIFSNGNNRPGEKYSSICEIVPPIDQEGNYHIDEGCAYGPEEPIWTYNCDFYAVFLGGTQRLSNGNTLICDGARGKFFEVTYNDKEIVWRYDNLFPYPLTSETRLGLFPFSLLYYSTDVFKINRYPSDYPGLKRLFGLK